MISFAISIMLTSAFLSTAPEGMISAGAGPTAPGQAISDVLNGLRNSGWHGAADLSVTTPASIPVSAAAYGDTTPPSAPITEVQLRKVLNIMTQSGTEASLIPSVAKSLGLGKNGEKVRIRQLAISDDKAIQYGFALLKDGSGYILDKGPRIGNRINIHLDENLKIVSAAVINSAGEFARLSPAEAEARLREVLATWAEYAEEA